MRFYQSGKSWFLILDAILKMLNIFVLLKLKICRFTYLIRTNLNSIWPCLLINLLILSGYFYLEDLHIVKLSSLMSLTF